MSNIEWTDQTWNPVRGCSRVSQGCTNCYAERQAHRFNGPGQPYEGLTKVINGHPTWTGKVTLVPEKLGEPLRWRKPRRVFVNSMSDMFHEGVADEFIERVLTVTAHAKRHTFQILTKRPERMRSLMQRWTDMNGRPQPNLWLGVSVEDQATADERIPLLLDTPAAVRFVSYEPALGPVDFTRDSIACIRCPWCQDNGPDPETGAHEGCRRCEWTGRGDEWGIDWLIVGGESGPGARLCDVAWIRSAVEQCQAACVPVFVKQLGCCVMETVARDDYKLVGLAHRKGGDPSEWPADLRVREWPR